MQGSVPGHGIKAIYHLLPDRYDTGDDRKPFKPNAPDYLGGNLRGVIRRIPYISDLGVDTLWLGPVNGPGYHGYHPRNFFGVNRNFGTIDDMLTLIERADDQGIRVLMDFVPNHMSVQSDIFQEALRDPHSDKRDWFHFRDDGSWTCFLKYNEIPKINLENPQAREYVTGAAKFWLEQGIAGFRLDHVIGPSDSFWRHFRDSVKAAYPHALLIGEATASGEDFAYADTILSGCKEKILGGCDNWTVTMMKHYAPSQGTQGLLDGVLDFEFMNAAQAYAEGRVSREQLDSWLGWLDTQFPPEFIRPAAVSNHDRGRISQYTTDQHKLEEIAEIQFSRDQPAIIYYGDEVGMVQRERLDPSIPHHDLLAREPMVWGNRQNKQLLERYQRLAAEKSGRQAYAQAAA